MGKKLIHSQRKALTCSWVKLGLDKSCLIIHSVPVCKFTVSFQCFPKAELVSSKGWWIQSWRQCLPQSSLHSECLSFLMQWKLFSFSPSHRGSAEYPAKETRKSWVCSSQMSCSCQPNMMCMCPQLLVQTNFKSSCTHANIAAGRVCHARPATVTCTSIHPEAYRVSLWIPEWL